MQYSLKVALTFGAHLIKYLKHEDFLTLYSMIAPFDAFENIMENGAFAPLEQMLHFQ